MKKDKIQVSVLIITYNQEIYIQETLDSIIKQQHNFTIEIIVCDDASTDRTSKILKHYSDKYPEIKIVLREKNLGIIKNFYDGIDRCKGEYIMICGGDDYWLAGKIEQQIKFMQAHQNTGLCYGDTIKINDSGNTIGSLIGDTNTSYQRLMRSNCVPACTICIRKTILNKYMWEIKPLCHTWKMEDYPLLLWVAANSKISYLKGECAAYRVLSNSACHFDKSQALKWLDYCKSRYKMKLFFVEKYPEISKGLKIKVSKDYITELLIRRSVYNPDLKQIVNTEISENINITIIFKILANIINNCSILNHCLKIIYRLLHRG